MTGTDALAARIREVRAELRELAAKPSQPGGFAQRHAERMSHVLDGLEEAAKLIGLTIPDEN